MDTNNRNYQAKVIRTAQDILSEEDRASITPAVINKTIDTIINMHPVWGVDLNREVVTDELIRRFSQWVGQDTTLKSEINHVAWLNSSRKRDWRYWERYRDFQQKFLAPEIVEKLDKSTDEVLSLLEDPQRQDPWDRRGLVVGHVQSGKTGHYTGLISKAADAGYKIIIVLAGMHNNLRSQTQMRLDEGFLGYETKAVVGDIRIIGVGEIDPDPAIRPNYATNRSDKGDFSTAIARNLGISPEQRPWLFVVKKNKTVLERLLIWIRDHVANAHDESGRKIVTNLPLLIIDDEADHASVDTGEQIFDGEGKPDEEHQPKPINAAIRRLLKSFSRCAYVGYTATPFANIFIHERGETPEDGPDLFPSSFIINLAAPSNYIGPARVFGLGATDERTLGLPLIRPIKDHTDVEGKRGWMPQKHKNGHIPLYEDSDAMPPSLQEAIQAFFLSCAIRYLRGQQYEHSSMLVHVTRFNSVQQHVCRQVEEYLRHIKQRLTRGIDSAEILRSLENLFTTDFMKTSAAISLELPDEVHTSFPSWQEVKEILPEVLADIQVRMINGTAKDALDYAENKGTGLKVIAIGGDKLARGLTLEGLCVSYFLRASKMYDTLMQMGRWFGYRPGYIDVCRLYTTNELSEWFGHIAEAAEELREEFDLMAAGGSTPRDYGLKVQSHSVLMVTSRLKMRSAKNLMLSFSGSLLETISFFRDKEILSKNLNAARQLVTRLGTPSEVTPKRNRDGKKEEWQGFLWEDVDAGAVIDFLLSYKTHPDVHKVNSLLLAEFIRSMNKARELTKWTVVFVGGRDGGTLDLGSGLNLTMIDRSMKGEFDPNKYSIGRLMSSRDEAIDLDDAGWKAALDLTRRVYHADSGRKNRAKTEPDSPNGPAIRRIRGFGAEGVDPHPERGVLFLYGIDPNEVDPEKPSKGFAPDTPGIIAFGLSFPGSNSGTKVEYKVNNVLWEQEYGSAD